MDQRINWTLKLQALWPIYQRDILIENRYDACVREENDLHFDEKEKKAWKISNLWNALK